MDRHAWPGPCSRDMVALVQRHCSSSPSHAAAARWLHGAFPRGVSEKRPLTPPLPAVLDVELLACNEPARQRSSYGTTQDGRMCVTRRHNGYVPAAHEPA